MVEEKARRIPIKVVGDSGDPESDEQVNAQEPVDTSGVESVPEEDTVVEGEVVEEASEASVPEDSAAEEPASEAGEEETEVIAEPQEIDWRDRAMRLQAEMENYRKRQNRLSEERVTRERERVVAKFLVVVDTLEQVISHMEPEEIESCSGVKLTLDSTLALLRTEGVEPMDVLEQSFDPEWHDAVAMIPAPPEQEEEMLVISQELKGYKIGDRLLRPARVIVAKKN